MHGLKLSPAASLRSTVLLSTLCCTSAFCASPGASVLRDSNQQDGDQPATVARASLSPEDMGDVLMARRKYVEAISTYQQVPNQSSILWNKLGIAQQHLFNEREARRDYERALRLDPKNAEATNNLGTILYSQKDYKGAIRLYKRALKLNPRNSTIYCNLGTAYFAKEKYKDGAEAYRTALELDPSAFEHDSSVAVQQGATPHQRAQLNYFLAKTYAGEGHNEKALKYLRLALAQGFNDRKKLMSDKEFAGLRETPEFRQLLSQEHLD
jgi:tetratricopeptide (TPR) repeat protein